MFKPLCVFRVYFKPEFRPHAPAEFELVAIAAADPDDAMRMLEEGFSVRGWRLVGWRAPDDPGVRLIDKVFTCHLLREHVDRIAPSELVCMFRTRGIADVATAEAV